MSFLDIATCNIFWDRFIYFRGIFWDIFGAPILILKKLACKRNSSDFFWGRMYINSNPVSIAPIFYLFQSHIGISVFRRAYGIQHNYSGIYALDLPIASADKLCRGSDRKALQCHIYCSVLCMSIHCIYNKHYNVCCSCTQFHKVPLVHVYARFNSSSFLRKKNWFGIVIEWTTAHATSLCECDVPQIWNFITKRYCCFLQKHCPKCIQHERIYWVITQKLVCFFWLGWLEEERLSIF